MLLHDGHQLAEWLLKLLLLGWHTLLLLSHLVAVHLHILRDALLLLRLGELLLLKLLLLLLLGWHALLLHLRCVRAGAVLPGRAVSPKRVAKGLLRLAAAWLLLLGWLRCRCCSARCRASPAHGLEFTLLRVRCPLLGELLLHQYHAHLCLYRCHRNLLQLRPATQCQAWITVAMTP